MRYEYKIALKFAGIIIAGILGVLWAAGQTGMEEQGRALVIIAIPLLIGAIAGPLGLMPFVKPAWKRRSKDEGRDND